MTTPFEILVFSHIIIVKYGKQTIIGMIYAILMVQFIDLKLPWEKYITKLITNILKRPY